MVAALSFFCATALPALALAATGYTAVSSSSASITSTERPPYNVAHPAATPAWRKLQPRPYGPVAHAVPFAHAAKAFTLSKLAIAVELHSLAKIAVVVKAASTTSKKVTSTAKATAANASAKPRVISSATLGCLDSTANDTVINLLFWCTFLLFPRSGFSLPTLTGLCH